MVNDYGVAALSCAFIEAIKCVAKQEQWQGFATEDIVEHFLAQGNIQAAALTDSLNHQKLADYLSPFFGTEPFFEIMRCVESSELSEPMPYEKYRQLVEAKLQEEAQANGQT